jgi:ATP-dependent RNA helicase DeaD
LENLKFSELEVSDEIKRAVKEMGFEEATPVQSQTIPLIMEGIDVIGQSQTGTGKTAAFAIPAIESIDGTKRKVTQVLILCPTRELALQCCDEFRKFAKYKQGIRAVAVFGGQPIDYQISQLRQGAEIVVGTPGRIMDHMRRKTLKFDSLSMVILDEADEMLNMGFREDIELILESVPKERQTVLFSATMPPEILRITKQYQKNPKLIKVDAPSLTVEGTEQYYCEVPKHMKMGALKNLVDYYDHQRTIIFCNTKRMVDDLADDLQGMGYLVNGLHGDMKQSIRTRVIQNFKSGKLDILIATDVAARGLDVEDVEVVINFDIPQDVEYYIHRIGRTGRAGKTGVAFSLVTGRKQVYELRSIERIINTKILQRDIPTSNDVKKVQDKKIIERLKSALKKTDFEKNENIIDSLVSAGYTPKEIAYVAINLLEKAENNASSSKRGFRSFIPYKKEVSRGRDNEFKQSNFKKGGKKEPYSGGRFQDSTSKRVGGVSGIIDKKVSKDSSSRKAYDIKASKDSGSKKPYDTKSSKDSGFKKPYDKKTGKASSSKRPYEKRVKTYSSVSDYYEKIGMNDKGTSESFDNKPKKNKKKNIGEVKFIP